MTSCRKDDVQPGIDLSGTFSYFVAELDIDVTVNSKYKVVNINTNEEVILGHQPHQWINGSYYYFTRDSLWRKRLYNDAEDLILTGVLFYQDVHISPDEELITYKEDGELKLMILSTGEIQVMGSTEPNELKPWKRRYHYWSPVFSRDSRKILVRRSGSYENREGEYTSFKENAVLDLVENLEISIPNNDSTGISPADAIWAPKGDQVLYSREGGIFSFDINTFEEHTILPAGNAAQYPKYSGDGLYIVYEEGQLDVFGEDHHLMLLDVTTQELKRIYTSQGAFRGEYFFNANSDKLLFPIEPGSAFGAIGYYEMLTGEIITVIPSVEGLVIASPRWVM